MVAVKKMKKEEKQLQLKRIEQERRMVFVKNMKKGKR